MKLLVSLPWIISSISLVTLLVALCIEVAYKLGPDDNLLNIMFNGMKSAVSSICITIDLGSLARTIVASAIGVILVYAKMTYQGEPSPLTVVVPVSEILSLIIITMITSMLLILAIYYTIVEVVYLIFDRETAFVRIFMACQALTPMIIIPFCLAAINYLLAQLKGG